MDSFCTDDHDSFPWFSPELDIHNQHHVSYYGDNETTDEVSKVSQIHLCEPKQDTSYKIIILR